MRLSVKESDLLKCSVRRSQAACSPANLDTCSCRHDKNVLDLLQLLDLSKPPLPGAVLEQVIMERKCDSSGPLPAQLLSCPASPSRREETFDLLMCAASVGSASATQALIDCGECQACFAWESRDKDMHLNSGLADRH